MDERPHLIAIEREDNLGSFSLPTGNAGEDVLLTPSEDEAEVMVPTDLLIEPVSPTLGKADWDDVNAELDEFLDSDDDDSEMDSELDSDLDSDASIDSKKSGESTSSRSKKRKRGTDSVDGSGEENSDDGSNGSLGSQLQKRKKRALERTTGLANVATVDTPSGLPSPDTTGPEEDMGEANGTQKSNGDLVEDEDDDDAFAREMMAEFERQSNDPEDNS